MIIMLPEPSQGKPVSRTQSLAADLSPLQTSGAYSTPRSGCWTVFGSEGPLPLPPCSLSQGLSLRLCSLARLLEALREQFFPQGTKPIS